MVPARHIETDKASENSERALHSPAPLCRGTGGFPPAARTMCGNFGLLLLHAASAGQVKTLLRLMLKITQMCVATSEPRTRLLRPHLV